MYDNYYEPAEINVKKDETIKFIVLNVGKLVHEFNIATKEMHIKHQPEMMMLVENEILWMIENYNINDQKIYMVGGSMGGAAGAIYANNHLNPSRPMVAATASASGILDCERRAIEMDGNNSMIEWFGGNYDEFPFEYHRNSAIYFADSTQSMHYNLQK
mgnify:CR=1 FL=1